MIKGGVLVSKLVGHRSYAMKPRQSRQVRKEATVTGRFVCSELPVSGFNAFGCRCPPVSPGFWISQIDKCPTLILPDSFG